MNLLKQGTIKLGVLSGTGRRIVWAIGLLWLYGCSVSQPVQTVDTIEPKLQQLITRYVDSDNSEAPQRVYGVSVYIQSPKNGFTWGGASGYLDNTMTAPLKPDSPIRIASITKTFVAAGILRLQEQGKLKLDAPISQYLKPYHLHTLKQGGYNVDAITVRHLLTHTSGLYDYADSEQFYQAFTRQPDYRWTRTEQLQGAMIWGKPYGQPGDVYTYSDTGYILLAEIIELLEKKSLGLALKHLLDYKALGLQSTWLESLEEHPDNIPARAHQYLGEMDFFNHDPSFDLYGGGGLVSTPKDMALFFNGLFNGGVYRDSATQEIMLSGIRQHKDGRVYPETYRLRINAQTLNGMQVLSHGGYFGTYVGYVPEFDLSIAINMTQHFAKEKKKQLFFEIIETLKQENKLGVRQ